MNLTDTNRPTPGAFGVVRTNSTVGPAIRLLTRSQVNHAFVVIEQLPDGDWHIMESQGSGFRSARLSKYADKVVVFSDPLLPEHARRVVNSARLLQGTPYNFLDIAALALLQSGLRWGWLLRRAQNDNRLICSQAVDRVYLNAGLHLFDDGRPDGMVTPGDLLMWVAQGFEAKEIL